MDIIHLHFYQCNDHHVKVIIIKFNNTMMTMIKKLNNMKMMKKYVIYVYNY